jgi:hypothetical protein
MGIINYRWEILWEIISGSLGESSLGEFNAVFREISEM